MFCLYQVYRVWIRVVVCIVRVEIVGCVEIDIPFPPASILDIDPKTGRKTRSLCPISLLNESSVQSVSSCSHLHLNLRVDPEIQRTRANSGGERNNSPPAQSVWVPGQCITTRLELLHTISILHTPTMYTPVWRI